MNFAVCLVLKISVENSLQTRGPIRAGTRREQAKVEANNFIILCQNAYPNNVNRGTALLDYKEDTCQI